MFTFASFQILHRSIDSIERRYNGTNGNGGSLIVCCKDLRIFKIDISGQNEYFNVADSLEKLSAMGKILFFRESFKNQFPHPEST